MINDRVIKVVGNTSVLPNRSSEGEGEGIDFRRMSVLKDSGFMVLFDPQGDEQGV